MMSRVLLTFLLVLSICSSPYAFQLAELETETAEDLLLFFEEEDLIIATRHEVSVKKAPAIATVITAKEIRNMGARNLIDILRKVPGVGVSWHDLSVYHTIEIRGIRTTLSEKVLFMIDGHSINTALNGTAIVTFFYLSADAIKRVEVIRGPGSALYGANAFMGVINVVTKKAEDMKGTQLTVGGGSFDTQHYSLLFGATEGEIEISGYLDYLNTDGPSSHIEQDSIGSSGETVENQEKPEAGFQIRYRDLTVRGGFLKNRGGTYIGAALALNDESEQDWNHYYLDIVYDLDMSENADMSFRLYGDHVYSEPFWELFPEGFPGYPEGMAGHPQSKEDTLGGEVTAYRSAGDHRFTFGGMYENRKLYDVVSITNFHPTTFAPLGSMQDISDWGNFIKEAKRDIWAVYIQDVWEITEDASLTAGIRHDSYSDVGESTNPRLGFVWEFIEDTSLKLLYGSAFRAPSFTELYQKNNPSFVGNRDLKPEKIQTYEVGIEHHFYDNFTARFNYFFNDITDLIVTGDKPSPTEAASLENRGGAEIHGVEAEFLFDLRNDYFGYLNYSYQDPRDSDTDERFPDVPYHRINAGINLAPWTYLNTNVNLSWTGERPRDDDDTRDELSSATLVDLTLIVKNLFKTLEIRGSVYNLFNEDYRDPSPFQAGSPNPIPVPEDYPGNRRMYMVEARYTF